MRGLESLEGHGPLLAVADGRFLPIDTLECEVERDTKQIQTITCNSTAVRLGKKTIDMTFTTGRRPQLRGAFDWMRLYNRAVEMRVRDIFVTEEAVDGDWQTRYVVNLTASEFEIMARRP